MRLEDERESGNVEDRRGAPGQYRGTKSIGITGILIALVAMYFGADPGMVLSLLQGSPPVEQHQPQSKSQASNQPPDENKIFVSKVLGSTEDVWRRVFGEMGQGYQEPVLVLYSGSTPSACGLGRSAMGPFYCPEDQKVYVDLQFFDELRTKHGAPGEFARAYVLAHEVGHHVQNLLGIADKVHGLQQRVSPAQANKLSVAMELQADCLAGVWANRAHEMRKILEQGDIESGLRAASAVGDDTLQKQAQGYVVPESFTHGSAEQRMSWFMQGVRGGTIKSCDTFSPLQKKSR